MCILADGRSYNIPPYFHIQTTEIDFTDETPEYFRKRIESEDAILVFVGGISGLPGGCGNDDIADGLMVIEEYTDGVIYIHPSHVLGNP